MSADAVRYAQAVLLDEATQLGAPARALLTQLAIHADKQSGEAWPGSARLSALTGYNWRTLLRAADELEASRLLGCEKRRGKSTVWRFPIGLAALPPTPVTATGVDNAAPLSQRQEPLSQRQDTPVTATPIRSMGTEKERAALVRCPARTSWRLCDPSCSTCHGTGHTAVVTAL